MPFADSSTTTRTIASDAAGSQARASETSADTALAGGRPKHGAEGAAAIARLLAIDASDIGQAIAVLERIAAGEQSPQSLDVDRSTGSPMVVIVSSDDETARMLAKRAADRLRSHPNRPIHDARGIYFQPEPLYAKGAKVGWIFPGEGAQYLGMLASVLEAWPEAQRINQLSDATSSQLVESYRPLSYFSLHWQGVEPREIALQRLRRLDNAMLSVLAADWVMAEIIASLQVPCDAMAGHSAGELAALVASGAMDADREFPGMAAAIDQMEGESTGQGAALLAVGQSIQTVEPCVQQVQVRLGRSDCAEVAMDNCPHQCIVVGDDDAITLIAQQCEAQGWIAERLALGQPYHTSRFGEFLGPLAAVINRVPFAAPRVPVYSCITAAPMPDDPDQIRQLSLAHWAHRVRWRELIENMASDGVRIFIEVGPRGNLSGFVADTLRGQPFAAIPLDVPRLPTSTQLVHAAAQLMAHGVPIDVRRLRHPHAPLVHPHQAVMEAHLQAMDTFLDTTSTVIQQYLRVSSDRTIAIEPAIRPVASEDRAGNPTPGPTAPLPSLIEASLPLASLPLLGEVVQWEPGARLVMRRTLTESSEPYAMEHTVGGRKVSRVAPDQHGLPIVPLTFTAEFMLEAAAQLTPDMRPIAMERLQLSRWLPVFVDDPITIRIEATVEQDVDVATRKVVVKIFDEGARGRPLARPLLASQATVVMATQYPDAPARSPHPLDQAPACDTSLEVLYNNLFHGPRFQHVQSLAGISPLGIDSWCSVGPREGLFVHDVDPPFIADPVLMDVIMHANGAWHLAQPDQTGRLMLPFSVDRMEFFGGRPDEGARFLSRALLLEESARHYAHTYEIYGEDDRLWCRITGLRLWRFYLPFHETNFHGPKDVYFLSQPLTMVEQLPVLAAGARFQWIDDLAQPNLLRCAAEVALSDEECQAFLQLKLPAERMARWMFGRIVIKDAVRRYWFAKYGERLFLADVEVQTDPNGAPSVRHRDPQEHRPMPAVSLTHKDRVSIAVAADCPAIGIDLERIVPRERSFLEMAFSKAEQQTIAQSPQPETETARLWARKEAIGKRNRLGLQGNPARIDAIDPAINSIEETSATHVLVVHW
jgi:malonyl CoA-acyl carrier protein transacylase/phosphopantetheinyl transferase (holo-ACP synthase)